MNETVTEPLVQRKRGIPCISLQGAPLSTAYHTHSTSSKFVSQFAEAGVRLHFPLSTCSSHTYGLVPDAWISPKRFDFSDLLQRAEKILEKAPDGVLIPQVFLGSPDWWNSSHRSHLVKSENRKGERSLFLEIEHNGGEEKPAPSWASRRWREDMEIALAGFVRALEGSSFASRFIGVLLASGITQEWMQWGSNGPHFTDFSRANAQQFRLWLKKRYRTVGRLQRAWKKQRIDFATAAIPSRAERLQGTGLVLREPREDRKIIDYYLYTSQLVADTLCAFARIVKKTSRKRLLCGAYYGYVLQLCDGKRQQEAGHMALERVLQSPHIDFLTSPNLYSFRGMSDGVQQYMVPLASCRLHNKVWIDQYDFRTHLTPWPPKTDLKHPLLGEILGYTRTRKGTLQQMRRELAHALCSGSLLQWFDMDGGWYADEKLMDEIAGHNRILRTAFAFPRDSVARIAVIVDPGSMLYTRVGDPLSSRLVLLQLPELLRMGAPFDLFIADDLPRIPTRYRMWIFLNLLAPSRTMQEAIETRVKRRGKTLLWTYGPGALRSNGISVKTMERLLDMKMEILHEERPLEVTILEKGSPLLSGVAGRTYGIPSPSYALQHLSQPSIAPIFYPARGMGRVLGLITGTSFPGLVERKARGITTFFSSAPLLPASLLRNMARQAGIPILSEDGDLLYLNRSFLALIPASTGTRRITLPRPSSLFSLLDGRPMGYNRRRIRIPVRKGVPRIFFLGTKRKWEERRGREERMKARK